MHKPKNRKNSQQKKTLDELKKSEKKYRELIDLGLVGFFKTTLEGEILYANEALHEMYGYKKLESFKKQGIVVRYRDPKKRKQLIKKLKSNGKVDNFEFEYLKKDGKGGVALMSAVLDGNVISGLLYDITQTKILSEKIQNASKEWRRSFDSIQDMVSIQDAGCRLIKVNLAYAKAVGSTPQELVGKKCFKVVHGKKEPVGNCPHIQTLKTKKTSAIEHYEPHLKKYFETSTSPIYTDQGKFIGTVHVSKDITVKKQIQHALKESEERYRTVYNTAPLAFVVWDTSSNIVDWNKKAEEIFGWKKKEVLGKNFFDFIITKEAKPQVENIVHSMLKGKIVSRNINDNLTKDGKKIICEWNNSIIRDGHGDVAGVISLGLDITDRKVAQDNLMQQHKFLRTVIESLSHPFYVIDANDYSIKMANSAAGFGKDALKKKCFELSHMRTRPCGTKNHPCTLNEVKKNKEPSVVEHIHYDKQGNRRYVEVHAHPIFDGQGNVSQIIEYTLDVTKKKVAEQKLKQAHDELEHKVRERTRELHKANIQLQNKIRAQRIAEKKLFELYKHLGITNRRISILLELNNHSGNIYKNSSEVIEEIVDSATNISGAKSSILFHYDSKVGKFYLLAANGIKEKKFVKRRYAAQKIGLFKKLAKTRKRIQGSCHDYDLKLLKLDDQVQNVLLLPIFIGGKMRGALLLGFDEKNNVTTQDLDLYEAFSVQASLALSEVDIIAGARY